MAIFFTTRPDLLSLKAPQMSASGKVLWIDGRSAGLSQALERVQVVPARGVRQVERAGDAALPGEALDAHRGDRDKLASVFQHELRIRVDVLLPHAVVDRVEILELLPPQGLA